MRNSVLQIMQYAFDSCPIWLHWILRILDYFQTCTVSHLDMIWTAIVFMLKMNIVHIIGEMMGSSCVGMPLIISMLIVRNNHGLLLIFRSLLVLIREIKTVIAFSGSMSQFEAYLTYNRV